jgi:antitoxin (DNA-binding transcriptional repressor) of toxin-antitoxin stability system
VFAGPKRQTARFAILTIVIDYGKTVVVEEIAVSKFKATCLALIEQVRKTRKPIRITRFGKPIAEVVPPSTPGRPSAWLGYMAGRGKITGDIISPATEESEWEVLRD